MLLILFILFIFPFCFFRFPKKANEKADCLLVLGCPALENGQCSPSLKRRLDKTIELYQQGFAPFILVSGGCAHNQYVEAEVMANYLRVHLNIEAITETQARNTYENFLFSKKICEEHHFNHILVVTGSSHVLRSAYFAKKFFTHFTYASAIEPFSIKKVLTEYFALYNTLYCEIKLKLKK